MAAFETVRVAAVQATPVILDAEATIDKAIELLGEAADDGATLVVFPECFVSVYPSGAWAAKAATWTEGCDELWERMWASSLDVRGPLVDRLTTACAGARRSPRDRHQRARGRPPGLAVQHPAGDRWRGGAAPASQADADDARAGVPRRRRWRRSRRGRAPGGGRVGGLSVGEPHAAGAMAVYQGARRSGWHRRRTTATVGSRRCDTSPSRRGRSW